MKRARKFLAVLLAAALVSGIPVSALDTANDSPISNSLGVAENLYGETDTVSQETDGTSQEFVEDQSLRTANIKQFKSGNSYVAAIYADDVHYEDEYGQWQEIDNTLELYTDSDGKSTYYENKANSFKVRLPSTIAKNDEVSVQYQGYTLAFGLLDDITNSTATIQAPKEQSLKGELSFAKTQRDMVCRTLVE